MEGLTSVLMAADQGGGHCRLRELKIRQLKSAALIDCSFHSFSEVVNSVS